MAARGPYSIARPLRRGRKLRKGLESKQTFATTQQAGHPRPAQAASPKGPREHVSR